MEVDAVSLFNSKEETYSVSLRKNKERTQKKKAGTNKENSRHRKRSSSVLSREPTVLFKKRGALNYVETKER